jgi:hypothetical protein
MKKNLKIKKIASIVRTVCERFAMSEKSKSFDFHKDPDLSCMCAIASATLYNVLNKNGYRQIKLYQGKFNGDTHCWVEDARNNIIDITATQFRIYNYVIRPVEIINKNHNLRIHYDNKILIPSLNSEIIQDWPDEQRADEALIDVLVNKSIKRIKQYA